MMRLPVCCMATVVFLRSVCGAEEIGEFVPLKNGDFERGFERWTRYVTPGAGAVKVEARTDASGSRCVHLRKTGRKPDSVVGVGRTAPVEPDTYYDLCFKVKKRLDKYGSKWAFRVNVETVSRPSRTLAVSTVTEPFDFGEFRCRFLTPSDCREVRVRVFLRSEWTGEAWIDDVGIQKVGWRRKAPWRNGRATMDVFLPKGAWRVRVFGPGKLQSAAVRVSLAGVTRTADVTPLREKLYGRNAYFRTRRAGRTQLTVVANPTFGAKPRVDRWEICAYDGPVELKRLYLKTPLANAVIVVPDAPEYQALANSIRKSAGLKLKIMNDASYMCGDYRAQTGIAVGNLLTNKLCERLYCLEYTQVDGAYPGPGRYVVHSVHDPWGTGKNVIVLGGSDLAGLTKAVRRFCMIVNEMRAAGKPLGLGRLFLTDYPTEKPNLELLRKKYFPIWSQRLLMKRAASSGIAYLRTGEPLWARLFYLCIKEHKRGPRLGNGTHMELWKAIRAWDALEEAPTLTDEERLEVARYLLYLVRSEEGAGSSGAWRCKTVMQNHPMFHALCAYFGGLYFGKYYHTADAKRLIERARCAFAGQELQDKGLDEACGYEGFTNMLGLLPYACLEPGYRFISSGALRRFADRVAMTVDNRFCQSGYGDWGDTTMFPYITFSVAAWAYRDGRYQWLMDGRWKAFPSKARDRRLGNMPVPMFYADGVVQPVEPTDLNGVRAAPLNEEFYRRCRALEGTRFKWNVPCEKAFDKMSFRTAFRADKQYMLLDGIACGAHGHFDANCIIRLTDNGRQWLVDDTYTERPFLAEHNGVVVTRDGIAEPMPACARLDAAANFDAAGLSRTTLPDHSGVDWERNVFWLKEQCFVVMDRLVARKPGDYGFSCRWRTLGKAEIQGRRLVTRQKGNGYAFHVVSAADAECTTKVDELLSNPKKWQRLPNAIPIVNVFCENSNKTLSPGQAFTFVNLLYATCPAEPRKFDMAKISESCAYVSGDKRILVGVADRGFKMGGLALAAGPFLLSEQTGLLAAQVRSITLDGKKVYTGEAPTVVAVSARRGLCRIQIKTTGQATVMGKTVRVKAGERIPLPGVAGQRVFRRALDEADAAARTRRAKRPRPSRPQSTKNVRLIWRLNAGAAIRVIEVCSRIPGIALGTESGDGILLDARGAQMWRFQAQGRINAIDAGDLDGDGQDEIVFASEDSHVYAYDRNGRRLWKFTCPAYRKGRGTNGQAEDVLVADLDGDRNAEVIVGARNIRLHILAGNGKERVSIPYHRDTHAVFDNLIAMDVDNDGRREVLAFDSAGSFGDFYVFTLSGKMHALAADGWPSHILCAASGDLSGAEPFVVFGTNRGNVYYVTRGKRGVEHRRAFSCGCAVTAIALCSRKGKPPQVAVGSEAGYVHVLDAAGKIVWGHGTGSPVSALAFIDAGRGLAAAGTTRNGVLLFDAAGASVGRYATHAPVTKLRAADLDKDDRPELVIGCADGTLHVVAPSPTMQRQPGG